MREIGGMPGRVARHAKVAYPASWFVRCRGQVTRLASPFFQRFPADEQHTHTMNVEVNQTKVRPRRGLAAAGMTAPEQEARGYDKVAVHGEKVCSCRSQPGRRRLCSCFPARPQPPGKPSPSQCMTWKRDAVTLGVLTLTALALRFYMIWCVFERHADDATTS